MSLSPEEIRRKDFLVALRGYDKEEVEAFLGVVADEYAAMVERLANAGNEKEAGAPVDADAFAGLGDQVESIMRTAVDGAARLQADSEREAAAVRAAAVRESERVTQVAQSELEAANELRAEAEQQAEQLRAEAREEVARLKDEARQELEAARQARRVAARESKELALSTNRRRDALVAEAQSRLAAMLSAAEQEIDQAVADVLRGCQRVHDVQGRPLVLPVEPANDAAVPEPSEAGVDPPTQAGAAAGGDGAA